MYEERFEASKKKRIDWSDLWDEEAGDRASDQAGWGRGTIEKAGSIADAAVQLSGVFQAAQEAADTYLKSIKAKEKELARLTKQAKKNMRD